MNGGVGEAIASVAMVALTMITTFGTWTIVDMGKRMRTRSMKSEWKMMGYTCLMSRPWGFMTSLLVFEVLHVLTVEGMPEETSVSRELALYGPPILSHTPIVHISFSKGRKRDLDKTLSRCRVGCKEGVVKEVEEAFQKTGVCPPEVGRETGLPVLIRWNSDQERRTGAPVGVAGGGLFQQRQRRVAVKMLNKTCLQRNWIRETRTIVQTWTRTRGPVTLSCFACYPLVPPPTRFGHNFRIRGSSQEKFA